MKWMEKVFFLSGMLTSLVASAAEIQSFSPQGSVGEVTQVRVAFSEAMVPFGDPVGSGSPFDVKCATGKGRWADQKNWIYDFDQMLLGGWACSFKLKPDYKTLAGSPIVGNQEFQFDTGGPSIVQTDPWEGGQVDENQIFVLKIRGSIDVKAVLTKAYFVVEGIQERISLKLMDKDPRDPKRWKSGESNLNEVFVQAKRTFPPSAEVKLVWGAGIAGREGGSTKEDQVLSFRSRPLFNAEMSCERENASAACSPISTISLRLSADVPLKMLRQVRLRSTTGKEWRPKNEQNMKDEDSGDYVEFPGPLPEKTQFELSLPKNLKDDANRPLANAASFPLSFSTAEFPPLIKFPAPFGILELKPEAVLPVTVRNVEKDLKVRLGYVFDEIGSTNTLRGKMVLLGKSQFSQIVDWRARLENQPMDESLFTPAPKVQIEEISLTRPNGDKAFEVLGIPLKRPGFYILEIESQRLGSALLEKKTPYYVHTSVLVTNLSVHLKKGRESSLVWVTTLDEGKPVSGAEVTLRDCMGNVLASGTTGSSGVWTYAKNFLQEANCKEGKYGFYATAEKGDDFSFVHSSWQRGIENWRFQLPGEYVPRPDFASTVLDRSLFRAGEIVHMKHFFRRHESKGITIPAVTDFPNRIRISHVASGKNFEFPLKFQNDGVVESSWTIPKEAKLGEYSVTLLTAGTNYGSGSFRVEEYRVPLMRAQIQPPNQDLVSMQTLPLDLSVEYLAGGGASRLPIQLRYQVAPASALHFPEFEDHSFGTGKYRDPNEESDAPEKKNTIAQVQKVDLDALGTARTVLTMNAQEDDQVKNLHLELEYRDPNGEIQTAANSVNLFPASHLISIQTKSRFSTPNALKFNVAVVDLRGVPVDQAPVEVTFIERKFESHRKRLVGGFYSYENKSEIRRLGPACSGVTNKKGILECDAKSPISGNLILEAKTSDPARRAAYAHTSTWIHDSEEWWFAQGDSDRIDLLPERKRYEVGETATFQVQMPFREATALVTVEREGIVDSFVTTISGKKTLIEVPIKENYSPNIYVSALVVRGRVGDVQPTALVDLGRPAYKLGISSIQVGWKPHELNVSIQPSKEVYQVREKGRFKVRVTRADGKNLPQGTEVAFAAVDEGLLQLKPNESWNLLAAMMQTRGYEVETYTAQSEVVGKRHFGLKALPSGGDGGAKAPTREIFNSLLYWQGKVVLDAKGEAEVQFPMNDSITGFKIAAIAHSGSQLFGTGYARIRTTQDLIILSGIPPLAREGDHLELGFTVRNTTSELMTLDLSGKAQGLPPLSFSEFTLAPNEAKSIPWTVDIPEGVSEIKYLFFAKDRHGKASDQIQVVQKIIPVVPVRIYQATLAQLEPNYQLPVEIPRNARVGRGGIRVQMDRTLLPGLEGARQYMATYPFTCLEQRVSQAVVLRDETTWKKIVAELPNYLDSDGLAKYFPTPLLEGSDILTAYLLSISHEAGWELPKKVWEQMTEGLKKFVEGRLTRGQRFANPDLTVQKLAALEALARYKKATWEMTGSLQVNPPLWPTSAVIDWLEFLKRMESTPDLETKKQQADHILRSRLNFQGTRLGFSTDNSDSMPWMMVSNSTNATRLLLSRSDSPQWKEEMGRIVNGIFSRQERGHWDTTTANAWGVLAFEKFSRVFEKESVTGTTTVTLNQKAIPQVWNDQALAPLDFEWPKQASHLLVQHSGTGKPWVTLQSRAVIPLTAPLSSGYRVTKTWLPVEQKVSGRWTMGDIARVRLELESQADMSWVVVSDPVPAGASILGSGLGNDSTLLTQSEKEAGAAWIAFQERTFDSYRVYYRDVPRGKWAVEYTLRLNQSGIMNLPTTRVEAMYAPEMFGELPNDVLSIGK